MLVFQILTGLRCCEVVAAKWSGLKDDVITIEAAYMKGKRYEKISHDVYLCNYAKEVIDRQPKKSEFIFFIQSNPSRHMSSETITKWFRTNGFAGELVGHGTRKLFSTWANCQKMEDGKTRRYEKDVIELCIAHKKSNVQTIYDTNDYAEDRMRIMVGWGDFVKSSYNKGVTLR